MRFNAKKCYILSILGHSSHFYQLNGTILQQVSSNPYLGVLLDENLSWTEQINGIAKRASSSLGLLRRNLRFCPQECRRTAYVSLVRSIMEYSSIIWDPHLQKDKDKLESIQRRGARFISQDYRSRQPGCMTAMLKTLNLPLLEERRKQIRLAFLYKIVKGEFPAMRPETYLKPIRNKRKIKPKLDADFQTTNIVERMARNNSRCFEVIQPKKGTSQTIPYTTSFFPRTSKDWNALDEATVQAESIEDFKHLLSTRAQE